MCLTIARPSPVPPIARERAVSTDRTARSPAQVLAPDALTVIAHGDSNDGGRCRAARAVPRLDHRAFVAVFDRVIERFWRPGRALGSPSASGRPSARSRTIWTLRAFARSSSVGDAAEHMAQVGPAVGGTCSFISIRDSDSRSSIRRPCATPAHA